MSCLQLTISLRILSFVHGYHITIHKLCLENPETFVQTNRCPFQQQYSLQYYRFLCQRYQFVTLKLPHNWCTVFFVVNKATKLNSYLSSFLTWIKYHNYDTFETVK